MNKEKINNYENLNNITKNKYENIIMNKEEEINQLNAKNLSYKIEKDKYFNDYSIIKKEFDKINQNFHSENDIYIKKYEEAQKNLNSISNSYEEKLSLIVPVFPLVKTISPCSLTKFLKLVLSNSSSSL